MIQESYKETEIGVIPEDWTTTTLEEISDFITKGATPTTYGFDWVATGIYFFKGDCVKDGKFVYGDYKYISEKAHDVMERSKVKAGDILLSIIGNIGKACRVPREIVDANINQNIARVRVNNQEIDSEFVFQWLSSGESEKKYNLIKTTQAYPQLSLKQVRETIIPIPSVKEQNRIADILSTTDAHIERLDKLIENYQLLKKGMMKKLLTEGIGHTEFKETEIGRMPKTWNITFLSQVADVKGGKRLPKGYSLQDEPNGYPYIRVADMYFGGVDQSEIKYVPIDAVDSINNYRISKADIFITVAGTLGIVGTIPESLHNANLTENADKICNIKCNKDYLVYYLQSDNIQNAITKEMTIGAQPKLALTRIKKFIIAVPSVEEQKEIVEIIRAIDERTAEIVFEHQDFMQLKKGLMERLLTGKIRTTELKPMEG